MKLRRILQAAGTLAMILSPSRATSHTVSLDGSAAEWFAAAPPVADLGRIARRGDGAGEYVWLDAAGDARPAWPSRPLELLELRVTGDASYLYVMARVRGPVATSGDSVPQLQVTLDTDRFESSGGTAFANAAGLALAGAGAYERLLETRFASGRAPRLLDAQGLEVATEAAAALSAGGVLEIAVPWSSLGYAFAPSAPLRMGAALFLTGADDVALDPGDGVAGRAVDVMTQYGSPGSPGTTATELADGLLGYTFDLWFDGRGEVVSPVVVNEIYFGEGVRSQWIEVVNATQTVVSLTEFKLGDQARPDDNDAIAHFPDGTLLVPGEAYVVARDGAAFLAQYGAHADAECDASEPGTPDMLTFPAWSLQNGFNLPTGGDEILVLDASNTVVDVVTYRNASWPGVVAHPGTTGDASLERARPSQDTDDCLADFGVQAAPTPGATAAVAAVGALPAGPLAWAPPAPNPARGRVSLALRLSVAGELRVEILDAAGRRTRELHDGPAAAGETRLVWDARDDGGRPVAPGVFHVRAVTREGVANVRVTVLR